MPTDEVTNAPLEPTDPVNAQTPVITDEQVKSHPLFLEAKKREAEARKKMDEAAIENKRLKAAVVGEEPKEEESKPQYITKDALEQAKWEIAHEKEIDLAAEEYRSYLSSGYKPKDALRLAHLDKGIRSENPKVGGTAQPGATVDRSPTEDISPEVQEDMRQFGYSKETYLKYKDMVLGKK